MTSFENPHLLDMQLPMRVVRTLAEINEAKGKQELYRTQQPQLLETLRQTAIIQSTESSNRIENIVAPKHRLRDLMADRTTPENRSEAEIMGYRQVLNTIHSSYAYMKISPSLLLQLHRDLYRFSPGQGGALKTTDNVIDEIRPDGTRITRFTPTPAWQTPIAIDGLCQGFNRAWQEDQLDRLVLIAIFILDFLCIHPFSDGNGRLSRLLTLLLLYHGGYEVGRTISLERLIEESKESYYEALNRSSQGWHEGDHDLLPWLEYLLGIILAAYRELERRVSHVAKTQGHGVKGQLVEDTILSIYQPFTIQDIQNACPSVSLSTIRKVMNQLRDQGLIECLQKGRNAQWARK